MSTRVPFAPILAIAALGFTTPLFAQARTAVTARPAGNRSAVQSFLASDQARTVAGQMGVSASELSARVDALDQASLDRIAEQTDVNDRNLAGGANTVVISTTTIIIALLLIILLTS
jgi:CHASE3 domain sensor protein